MYKWFSKKKIKKSKKTFGSIKKSCIFVKENLIEEFIEIM